MSEKRKRWESGPLGLGDPDDKSLYSVEKLLIDKKIREAAELLCKDEMMAFGKCASDYGFKMASRCREQNVAQYNCLQLWMSSESLREKMTEEYLEERSRFRATGIPTNRKIRGGHG